MRGRLESRKLVTVVFSDLVGSTALAERLDPEVLAQVLAEYFERMAAVLVAHGGNVREFIGDALMAVFGVPELHEDDAERAVRAALAMSQELERLNAELARSHGITLVARTGINAGEVLAGRTAAGQEMVLGDAINVAARLAGVAGGGVTLVGEGVVDLVSDLFETDEVEPVEVRGRSQPVRAWRLVGERPPAARLRPPLIGRIQEMHRILAEIDAAFAGSGPRTLLLVGEPGIGKSRLIEEAVDIARRRAVVLVGRCTAYGGFGLSHLSQIVGQAIARGFGSWPSDASAVFGSRARAVIRIVDALAEGRPPDGEHADTLWAVQRLVLGLAEQGPVMVVLEDVHLAREDGWEIAAGLERSGIGSPLLLLCSGRPELLELDDRWREAGGRRTVDELGPLSDAEAAALLGEVLQATGSGRAEIARTVEVAGGNPLFLREIARELASEGGARAASIPRSLFALLSARLERLPSGSRAALSDASVIGPTFRMDLLRGLDEGVGLGVAIDHLRREGLVVDTEEGGTLRFDHELIRDTAYGAMPRRRRAALHERAGRILAREDLRDDALIGHHFERAYLDRVAIGLEDDRSRAVAALAATYLRAGGRAAVVRGEVRMAGDLLERARRLDPSGSEEALRAEVALAEVLGLAGRVDDAQNLLADVGSRAAARGLFGVRARSELESLHQRMAFGRSAAAEVRKSLPRLVRALHRARDHEGLAHAYLLAAQLAWYADCSPSRAERYQRRAIGFARRAGDRGLELTLLTGLASIWAGGPLEAREVVARCRGMLSSGVAETPVGEMTILASLSVMEAMTGALEVAHATLSRAVTLREELGISAGTSSGGLVMEAETQVAIVGGASDRVERITERWLGFLDAPELVEHRAYVATVRAGSLVELGRVVEAERQALQALETPHADSPWLAQAPAVLAVAAAARGARDAARRLVAESLRQSDVPEGFGIERARVRLTAARALAACDRGAEAATLLDEAARLFEAKGDVPEATRARALLERPGSLGAAEDARR